MPRRVGMTLVEVLVAIFVMAIGMISLLTLFPIGALRMAEAIQYDKCAQAGVNASAIANAQKLRTDPALANFFADPDGPPSNLTDLDKAADTTAHSADDNGPSYAIYVDPVGCQQSVPPPTPPLWLPSTKIARRPPSFATTNTQILKWFTLLDDVLYNGTTGYAANAPVIQREINYSWAYMLQRPRTGDSSVVNCTVVVYNKRPISLTASFALPEFPYAGVSTFDASKNSITIDYTSNITPPLRAGDWILDATVDQVAAAAPDPQPHPIPHANFYRVVGVNQIAPTQVECEVDRPLRNWPLRLSSTPNVGTAVVLEGVVDVFEKGPGWH